MNQVHIHKKFIFNEKIDQAFLFHLYEDDFPYIREVFCTTLENFDGDVADISRSFHSNDLQSLQRAVHKMKPVFGFTGLLAHQERISEFEKTISLLTSMEEITEAYRQLLLVISDGKTIIINEYRRLNELIPAS